MKPAPVALDQWTAASIAAVAAAHNVRFKATPPTLLVRPEIEVIARACCSEGTNQLAADMLKTREIDTVVVVGKTEPQRIFELLGRKGEVERERLVLRDAYAEALDAYRCKDWEQAIAGFEDCLAIVPCDAPSKLFLERTAQFRVTPHVPSGLASGRWVEK